MRANSISGLDIMSELLLLLLPIELESSKSVVVSIDELPPSIDIIRLICWLSLICFSSSVLVASIFFVIDFELRFRSRRRKRLSAARPVAVCLLTERMRLESCELVEAIRELTRDTSLRTADSADFSCDEVTYDFEKRARTRPRFVTIEPEREPRMRDA